jgi:outer membrane protein assembly factor BamB
MNNRHKSVTVWLIVLLAVSGLSCFFPKTSAAQNNPTYEGTKNTGDQLDIKFSEYNNSAIYLDDKKCINFSVGIGRYCFDYMSLGAFIYSVSYKASWQSGSATVYSWSYNDPANLKDDDPSPQMSFQGTISLNDAPLGNQQVTVNALAGDYVTCYGVSYWIYIADTSLTLNFTVASQTPITPSPTFSYDSGILWRTDIPWNLTGTPAQNKWDTDISDKSRGWTKAVIENGVVYAAATSTVYLNYYGRPGINWVDIYAFNADNGRVIWDYSAAFSLVTNLAVADGKVYFGEQTGWENGSIVALDAANGKLIWATPGDIFYSTPVTEKDRVFINSDHSVLALDSVNGKILWNYTASDTIVSPPVVANGVLYVAANDASFYAINTEDGSKLWSYETNDARISYDSTGNVVNGVLYLPSNDDIYALNAKTGAKIWGHNTTPPEFKWVNFTAYSTPAYYDGTLYFTSFSEQHIHNSDSTGPDFCQMSDKTSVYALEAGNGNKIWNYTVNNCALENPVEVYNGIVFTQEGNSIVGFNAGNGALTWNFTNPDLQPSSQPIIVNGTIYVGYSDGQLYALRAPSAGTEVENPNIDFSLGNQNIVLLTVIVSVVAAALVALTILYRGHRSWKTLQTQKTTAAHCRLVVSLERFFPHKERATLALNIFK